MRGVRREAIGAEGARQSRVGIKADLVAQWEMSDARMADLESRGWKYMKTSARDGAAVEEIFTELGQMMMQSK